MTITFEEYDSSVILNLSKRQNLLKMKTGISESEVNRNRKKVDAIYACCIFRLFFYANMYIFFRTFLFEENNDDNDDEKMI